MTVGHLGACHLVDVNWLAINRAASLLVVTWQLRNWLAACPLAICELVFPSSLLLVALVLVLRLVLRACWMASGLVHFL